jgi:hypothetical protein
MIKSKFELLKEALLRNREGDESIAELRSEYPQIYKWNKRMLFLSMETVPWSLQGHRTSTDRR